ncbi:hypothetical protein [Desulfogranum japonicum]|uniref:hypothetical protein n=1 Tax=Desulfogranum japonicum TaxID=231447 RepID=UPI0004135EE2|nr:hypothetical protein [Desulfogranum japonicum]
MKFFACTVGVLLLSVTVLFADDSIVPYHFNFQEVQGIQGVCGFEDITFPLEMKIYAGGAYSGKETPYQIDQSGHQATRFEVLVNSPQEPVALLLGSYEPSIWNISWSKDTRIMAVIVSGYHRQAVAGLPESVPILNSSYDNHGPCGYFYVTEKKLGKLNPISNQAFGRNVDLVHFASKGILMFGAPINSSTQMFTSKDTPPESFIDNSQPLAGKMGLDDLVNKGLLRPATTDDLDRWADLTLAANPKSIPPVAKGSRSASHRPRYAHNAFVILDAITIPAGLYGVNSATFFLKEGVPYPQGNLGHSTLYNFNDMTCRGTACNR